MRDVPGMLVLYHHEFLDSAPTVNDHVRSFTRSNAMPVWLVNTEEDFPPGLWDLRFRVIVIHYSLSGYYPHLASGQVPDRSVFSDYVRASADSLKLAFFQDEHHYCQGRFEFINDYGIDVVFSLLDPAEVPKVYGRFTPGTQVEHTLTGYVPDDLIEKSRRWSKRRSERRIDVGYRGRPLPYSMGRGSQEKTIIADEFVRRTKHLPLRTDVRTAEKDRIYGDNWYRFIADCRAMLGVEAGVSVFDLDDSAKRACDAVLADEPGADFETVYERALKPYEDKIYYRTISPRVFEAAAFRTCQVLFEGRYNDLLQPMVHYIPLKKDFSNLDEVLRLLEDDATVERITERAYQDLIASGAYSFDAFIASVDDVVQARTGMLRMTNAERRVVSRILYRGRRLRRLRRRFLDFRQRVWWRLHEPFPGKELLKPYLKPVLLWLFVPSYRKRR